MAKQSERENVILDQKALFPILLHVILFNLLYLTEQVR